jgi:tRNA (mo5U34)-methyltransferase
MPHHPAATLTDDEISSRIASVPHWYHQIEIRPGIVTPGVNSSGETLARLDLPQDCSGLRALDLGARDGFFAFELERRGADVVAIDYMDPAESGFDVAKELLGSDVECEVCNLYDLAPERHGTFDVVLFLGLLYHLRDPLLALDRIWDVCRDGATLALETQVLDNALVVDGGRPRALADIDPQLREACLMQFYPGDSLNGDQSNYWSPNAACVRGLLRDAGFEVGAEDVSGARGIFLARRTLDATTAYHRHLEKTTVAQARPPRAAAVAAGPGPAARDERAAAEVGSARQLLARSETELAGAREYIGSLEAEVARKQAHLVSAYARAAELEAQAQRAQAELAALHAHEPQRPPAPSRRGASLARRLKRAAAARRAR